MTQDTTEGQQILKDKFITQSAPDIGRKLQKLSISPKSTLENLLKVATSVFYIRNQQEQEMKNKRDKAKVLKMEEVIVATLQEANKSLKSGPGSEQSVLVTCYNCGQAGLASRSKGKPPH